MNVDAIWVGLTMVVVGLLMVMLMVKAKETSAIFMAEGLLFVLFGSILSVVGVVG